MLLVARLKLQSVAAGDRGRRHQRLLHRRDTEGVQLWWHPPRGSYKSVMGVARFSLGNADLYQQH